MRQHGVDERIGGRAAGKVGGAVTSSAKKKRRISLSGGGERAFEKKARAGQRVAVGCLDISSTTATVRAADRPRSRTRRQWPA